ncbi:hypothetical protein BP6252_05680 [Coleophoma cylindrospora]|uniref:Uncharacterized protein n=1 Tax=Coleophoma cylindrospora TaxID=1849047 RepID=A0A3D8RU62_9HELO|nr:hypothetical protein BP6252_05680 [Coleophoma cylindrospora]
MLDRARSSDLGVVSMGRCKLVTEQNGLSLVLLQGRILQDVPLALLPAFLDIHEADADIAGDGQAQTEGKALPGVARAVDDDTADDGPDPRGALAHQGVQGEEGDLAALGADVREHGGGEGVEGRHGGAVDHGEGPDFPEVVEAEPRRADADTAPDGDDEQEAAVDHQDHFGADLEVPLDHPEDEDPRGVGDALHDVQLRRGRGAVGDDGVLADAVDLVGCCVAVGDEEVAQEVEPGLGEARDALECVEVCFGSHGEIGLALGKFGGARLLHEEPGGATDNPDTSGYPDDDYCCFDIRGAGVVGVQPICCPESDEERECVSDAHATKSNVAQTISLKHLRLLEFCLGHLASLERSL